MSRQNDTLNDFTLDSYRGLLRAFRTKGYRFALFPEAPGLLEANERFLLLRHDVDFDPAAALRMAQIDAEEEADATFFFLLRTDMYNIFSAEGSAAVREILKLGHKLGLHFDCAVYAQTLSITDLAEACGREASVLEEWFGTVVNAVSYHRPNELVLTRDPALSAPRCHTYMEPYTKRIHYVSDSQGSWRHGAPLDSDAFLSGRPMQLLVHPIWWQETEKGPYETLVDYRNARLSSLETAIARNCKVYRRGAFANIMD
jgi:hypothetical protein